MANMRKPRSGSMAYWPRKRASRIYPRIRSWSDKKFEKVAVLGFAGYKVGMTHVMGIDTKKTSLTKNEEISLPVTVIECPPIRFFAVRFYKKSNYGICVDHDFLFKSAKELERKVKPPKQYADMALLDKEKPEDFSDITVIAYTNPGVTTTGKKKPELFEMKLNGSNKEKLEFIKAHHDKEITIDQIFKEGQFIDTHAVSRGHGLQGPIRRFGIAKKPHKSEKGVRQPGCRSGWYGWLHMMYRTAYAGQTGYHQRLQVNAQILKISNKPEEVNPEGGFPHYGVVRNTYILVKGSVPGAQKRPIFLTQPIRQHKESALLNITHISRQSKQGK